MPLGIIVKGIGGFYYINTENGLYECKARGIFRKNNITPLIGDKVEIIILDEDKKLGNIEKILDRSSELLRPAVSNINLIALVIAAKSPIPDLLLLDKLLISAEVKNIEVVICINKLDIDDSGTSLEIENSYKKAGYKVIKLSNKLDVGFDELNTELTNRITVLAGQSGVGKSTILNRILDSMVMQTGEVSSRADRGKHTTRHAELLELKNGGYIVDTPGFSSFELSEIEAKELEIYYPEFRAHLNKCKFKGCSHISEPFCSVKSALEVQEIDSGRYERYIQLYSDVKSSMAQELKNRRKKN